MYEKPQYLTPDGYRRLPAKPGKKRAAKKALPQQAAQKVALERAKLKKMSGASRGISKEAAKIIAEAIKAMLQQK